MMQFFNTVYLAVKLNRPLIQNFRVGVSNDVSSCILNPSLRAFSSKLDSDQEAILSSIPHKPKKPASIYIRYVKMIEPKLIQQYPNAKRTEIIKAAAELYNAADKETLVDLQNSYFKDVEQYKKNVEVYESKLTDEQKEALSKLKSIEKKDKIRRQLKKDKIATNRPKQPLNPYMVYVRKRRAEETPTNNILEWTKKVANEWKNLPEDEKKAYIAEAEEIGQKYKEDISKWEASLENTEYSHLVQISKKPENKAKNKKSKSTVSETRVSSAPKGKVPQNKKL